MKGDADVMQLPFADEVLMQMMWEEHRVNLVHRRAFEYLAYK